MSQTQPEERLRHMLSYRRPAGSSAEHQFIERFLEPLGVDYDAYGNVYKRIGDTNILFSSHTDTVHMHGGRQNVRRRKNVFRLRDSMSNCLGADDGAGVWLMSEMIRAEVPGLYVFHREEEIGGRGSAYIADHNPDLLHGVDIAIAFDRKGTGDVITHQFGSRCCSDSFARSLASLLGKRYSPDDTGSFTDTANYTHIVPECTNISVGYYSEHRKAETLDVKHLLWLRDRMVGMDMTGLPVDRIPEEEDDWMQDYLRDRGKDYDHKGNVYDLTGMDTLCKEYPEIAADLLREFGCSREEFLELVDFRYGYVVGRHL